MTFYDHWRDVPAAAWRWPNFSPAEIACRGTGKLLVNEAALDALQALRTALAKPLIIRSAYRSPEHNRAVGGAKASKHPKWIASTPPWPTTVRRPSGSSPGRSGSSASPLPAVRVHLCGRGARASGSRNPNHIRCRDAGAGSTRQEPHAERCRGGRRRPVGAAEVEVAKEALAET
jgi:hypothetical protein